MLGTFKALLVGLATVQFCAGTLCLAETSDAANIRSLRASALQHCAQGDIEIGLRSFGDAIKLAERSFGKDSTYVADLCFDAGVAALKKDQFHDAEGYLTKAVSINPNAQEARLKLAEYYKIKGRLQDAKDQISKVLNRDPVNLEARELLALTYQKEGNAARATQECFKVEELASGHTSVLAIASPMAPPVVPTPAAVTPITTGKLGTFSRLAPATPPAAQPAPATSTSPPELPAPQQPAAPKPQSKPTKQSFQQSLKSAKMHERQDRLSRKGKHDKKHRSQFQAVYSADNETGSFGTRASLHSKAIILNGSHIRNGGASAQAVEPRARTKRGLVPPPPPVVPIFQPPVQMPPPQVRAPAPLPKPAAPAPSKLKEATPREDPGEEAPRPAARSESHAGSSGGGDDDGDFLIDWAGKKKKKGK